MQQGKFKYKPDPTYGYLDLEGACALLGCSQSKMYKLVSRREIPHFKIGRRVLFKADELNEYISNLRVEVVSVCT
jgi:excisionase family DNA binding protein